MSEEIREEIREEDEEEDGINLLKYFILLLDNKKLIMLITLPLAIVLIIASLLSGNEFYEAHTSILPPEQQQMGIGSDFLGGLGILSGRSGKRNKMELMVELITSRTFMTKLIKRLGLQTMNGSEDLRGARSLLEKRITITPSFDPVKKVLSRRNQTSPLLRITVVDFNANKAAEIANTIVEELQTTLNEMDIAEAAHRKVFFEKQLKQAAEALSKSEEEVRTFQEKTGLFRVETQTGMVLHKIADLRGQIMAKEISLQVMKSYSTSNNPDVQLIEETLKGLNAELAKLESSEKSSQGQTMSMGNVPALGLEYKRILRQMKFNETLYEIMIKQYEAARLDEAKNASYIQVVDKAIPAEKSKSVRRLGLKKAFGIIILFFVFSCIFVLIKDYIQRRKTLR